MTSGSLCAVGDVLAQSIAGWYASRGGGGQEGDGPQAPADKKKKKGAAAASAASASAPAPPPYDACRTLRMAGFGLLFYGPYQYYWYSLLEHLMPARTVPNFAAKVAANQLFLAPVTLTVAFAWHLAFSSSPSPAAASSSASSSSSAAASSASGKGGRGSKKAASPSAPSSPSSSPPPFALPSLSLPGRLAPLPDKLRADFVPALLTGWKFWVPAASVNFCAVPLRQQVLYMSCCGVLWTAYLSHASGNGVGGNKAAAAPAPAAAAGKRR